MQLSEFITNLLTQGKVSVQSQLAPIEQQDLEKVKLILATYYAEDIIEMPYTAPAFSEEAALWGAEYLYRAVQLTVLRDPGQEVILEQLKPYQGQIDPSAIYSADLLLRYLPRLFELAKGLAPGDLLVTELRHIALQWPFSSVGIDLDPLVDDEIIFTDISLKYAYIDRIIREKDKGRIKKPAVTNYIHEVTGEHLPVLWPGFEN
jgi:hypothetical protein